MKIPLSPKLFHLILLVAFCLSLSYCKKEQSADSSAPSVITAEVTDISYNSARCGGNVSSQGESPVTARGVCWSSNPNPTVLDNHTTDGSGTGEFASVITQLLPLHKYYVRAYATNGTATAYGDEKSFTTTAEQGPVANLVANTTIAELLSNYPGIWDSIS